MVETCNCDVSPCRTDPYRIQYDGADAIRPGAGRALRVRALSLSVCRDGCFWVLALRRQGAFFARSQRRLAGTCGAAAGNYHETWRSLHARDALPPDYFRGHAVSAGVFWFHGYGQLRSWRWTGCRFRTGKVVCRPPADERP